MSDTKLVELEKRVSALEKKGPVKPERKREPTEYNKFMGSEINKINKEYASKGQSIAPKDALKLAAKAWKELKGE